MFLGFSFLLEEKEATGNEVISLGFLISFFLKFGLTFKLAILFLEFGENEGVTKGTFT